MNRQDLSRSRVKSLVGLVMALLAALAISAIILPRDTAISNSSSTSDSLSEAPGPNIQATISISGATTLQNPPQIINAPGTSQIPGSVTVGDGSIPPDYCVDVELNSTGTGFLGFFPWGQITVSISSGVPPGTYKFWAGPGHACNFANFLYCWSPFLGSMTCVHVPGQGSVCSGSFDIELYANHGNFSGNVYQLPQGILVEDGSVSADGYDTPIDADGYYNFALFRRQSNNWGIQLLCGNSRYNLGTPFNLTAYVPGLLGASARATTFSSQNVVVDLFVKDPTMEEPCLRACPNAGLPISIATGNMYLDQTDSVIPSLGADLVFTRSYNSQLAYRNITTGFGPGWSHAYLQSLSFPATGVIMLRQSDGVPSYFQDIDNNFTYEASVPFTKESWIEKQPDGSYILRFRKGGYETYDSAGQLASSVDAFGNVTSLERDGSGRLTTIHAPGSRSLTLVYNASNRISSQIGPEGLIAEYTYDTLNRLQQVSYGDGRGYTFTYDGNRQLLTVSDLSGKVLETHTYSGNMAITSEISEGHQKHTFAYGALQTTVTDALGNASIYEWTNIWGMKYVTKVTGPCASCSKEGNQTQQWTYDNKGRVLSYTDGNGNQTTYLYDANGDLISVTDPAGNITTYTINTDGRRASATMKSVVDPLQNKVTAYEYDHGRLKSQIESGLLGNGSVYTYTTTYTYNAIGKLVTLDGPRTDVSDVTTLEYDLQTGDLIAVTQPLVGTTTFSDFTLVGRPQSMTDPNGVTTTYQYDSRQRITGMSIEGDAVSYEYSPSGKLTKTTFPRLNSVTNLYDAYDQLASTQSALGDRIQYTYDLMGRRTKMEIFGEKPQGTVQIYLPMVITAGTNLAAKTPKPAAQQADEMLFRWQSYEYDNLSRLIKIVNPDGSFTGYGYDGAGNRTSQINPRSYTTTFQYDELNRRSEIIQPGIITTTHAYDSHSNLTLVTDPDGRLTTYSYDDMGRLYQEISPDTGISTFNYDEAGNRITKTDARGITINYEYDALNRLTRIDFPTDVDIVYTYDNCPNGKGRLCQVVDQSGTTSYTYSAKGELLQESKTIASVTYVTEYSYDPNSNLINIAYPSGRTATYTYDLADRVKSVATKAQGGITQTLATSIFYLPYGDISSFIYGNGQPRMLSYDNQYRITAISSGNVQHLTYSLDPNGNITAVNDLVNPARSKTFSYDALDRLQEATGPWDLLAWTYDRAGNRLTQTDSSGASTYNYQPASNRLGSISGPTPRTLAYDPSGNTTTDNARSYVYNEDGRMVQALEGPAILGQYTYNANQQRVTKTDAGVTTVFHFDYQGRLIAETLEDGSLVTEYINLNSQPLAMADGETLAYIHTDHLGAPMAMIDSNGMKVWEIETRAFGDGAAISGSNTLNLRFPGQYFEQETGLHQNWFRSYDPASGRYTQSDPLGLINSSLNPYSYALNNPLKAVDPDGRRPGWKDIWDKFNDWKDFIEECKKAKECSDVVSNCQAEVTQRCNDEFGTPPPSRGGILGSGDPKWYDRTMCDIRGNKCCNFKMVQCERGDTVANLLLKLAQLVDEMLEDCVLSDQTTSGPSE